MSESKKSEHKSENEKKTISLKGNSLFDASKIRYDHRNKEQKEAAWRRAAAKLK
ncbi:MAG: hypothetical protein ABR574_12465 [Cryomorphaceae bacterium]